MPELTVSTSASVIAENEVWNPKEIQLRNSFGGDSLYVTGKVYLNSEEVTTTGYNYASRFRQYADFPQLIYGEDNQYLSGNGTYYYRKWRKWIGAMNDNISQTLINTDSKTAKYVRQCNVTIQNDFGAAGNGGTIKFNNSTYNSPYQPTSPVYEDVNSTVEGLPHSLSHINFTFSHWEFESSNIGSSNPKTDFKPTSHGTLKAKFTGKPTNGYRNLSFNYSEEGQPIEVTWSKHPLDSTDITKYEIYRKVTTSGLPVLLTTVYANGSTTYTYTDYDYAISSGENKILLFYDVRAYYSPSSTYADADFEAVYGIEYIRFNPIDLSQNITNGEIPEIYSINNYPNPFNPTTTINYQIPEAGFVTLKVYDILGKEVVTLVNENKHVGYHSALFTINSSLSSGIYIYTFQCNGYKQSRKMLLTK